MTTSLRTLPAAPLKAASQPSPLDAAPPEVRAELNRTYTQYRYLSGMTSEISLVTAIVFFVKDHGVLLAEINQALRDCRSPECMAKFKFASDFMSHFAGLVNDQKFIRELHKERLQMVADRSKEAPCHENRATCVIMTANEIQLVLKEFKKGWAGQ